MKWLLIFCSFFIFFISTFSSCDLSMFANNRSRQYSIVSPEDEISQIPTDDFFFINLKSAYYTGAQGSFDPLDFMLYEMDEGPGTDCKISVNEESATEDLYCMLEVSEGDLWFQEITLEYNVPPGMCSYLAFMPHWHYNQPTGKGPTQVYTCIYSTGSGNNQEEEERYTTQDHTRGESCRPNVDYKKEIKDLCPILFDRTGGEGGNNSGLGYCCIGTYRVYGSDDKKGGKWGGDIKNCIGGLARMNWTAHDTDGYPAVITKQTGNKIFSDTYTLKPLFDKIDQSSRSSLPTANYILGMEDGPQDKINENRLFYEPTKEKQFRTNLKEGKPFTTWACLDQNKEVKHTIKLIVREWNTQEEFIRFKESNGSRGDPDVVGAEGSGCDYYENKTLSFGDCDDLDDIDKFITGGSRTNTCTEYCEDDKEQCEGDCDDNKEQCEGDCDDNKEQCEGDCEDDKEQCEGDCDDPGGTCKTACDDPGGTCKTACAGDNICEGDCDDPVGTCKTACEDPGGTCKGACTTAETACKDDGDDDNEDTNPDCATENNQCKGACTTAETACKDDGDDDNEDTNPDCATAKTTCDKSCGNYPFIKYK